MLKFNIRNYILPKCVLFCWLLTGLAVAVDENFKTFQAAYPFVVRKLLYDNSLASRKILYSVSPSLALFFSLFLYIYILFCRRGEGKREWESFRKVN